jgi:hypothetical protein
LNQALKSSIFLCGANKAVALQNENKFFYPRKFFYKSGFTVQRKQRKNKRLLQQKKGTQRERGVRFNFEKMKNQPPKKKARPKKSRPLLTYEKHQAQI